MIGHDQPNPSGPDVTTPAPTPLERMFNDGFATGDTTVDQVCTPDLVEHQFRMAGTGSAAVENINRAILDRLTAAAVGGTR